MKGIGAQRVVVGGMLDAADLPEPRKSSTNQTLRSTVSLRLCHVQPKDWLAMEQLGLMQPAVKKVWGLVIGAFLAKYPALTVRTDQQFPAYGQMLVIAPTRVIHAFRLLSEKQGMSVTKIASRALCEWVDMKCPDLPRTDLVDDLDDLEGLLEMDLTLSNAKIKRLEERMFQQMPCQSEDE